MLTKFCFIVSALCFSSVHIEGVKILAVYPVPGKSRNFFFRTLTQELLRRGHELVVITTDPAYPKGHTPKNLTEIDVHDISYKIWNEKFLTSSRGNKQDAVNTIRIGMTVMTEIFDNVLHSPEISKMLHDNKDNFDLILVESVTVVPLAFSHFYKVPIIQISSMVTINGNFECVGGSSHPVLYPSMVRHKLYNLTTWDKLTALYKYSLVEYYVHETSQEASLITKRHFGSDISHYNELSNKVHLLFLNMHPMADFNRPVPPTVTYIGGIYQVTPKALPEDLKHYLDSSTNGCVGTNTTPSTLKPSFIKIMLQVFSELPYDILFKWNLDELPGKSSNIKNFKWLPQPDVLRHPKVKLFITQGGMQSTDEAIAAGVPLIGIPMMTDQWFNTENYVKYKYGQKLDADTLTREEFKTAITNVLGDKSYHQNMVKYRSLVFDQPQQPMDRAMWWIDHVIRHSGAGHLRAPAANVTWTQYFELELVSTILLAATCLISTIVYTIKKIVRCY